MLYFVERAHKSFISLVSVEFRNQLLRQERKEVIGGWLLLDILQMFSYIGSVILLCFTEDPQIPLDHKATRSGFSQILQTAEID